MTHVTAKQLARVLGVSVRRILQREGSSMPEALPHVAPRQYLVAEVLWIVDGDERERIARGLRLDADYLRAALACAVRERHL